MKTSVLSSQITLMPCILSWFWAMCRLIWSTIVTSFSLWIVHVNFKLFCGHQSTLATPSHYNDTPDTSEHGPEQWGIHGIKLFVMLLMSSCIFATNICICIFATNNNGSYQLSEGHTPMQLQAQWKRVKTLMCHIFWLSVDHWMWQGCQAT